MAAGRREGVWVPLTIDGSALLGRVSRRQGWRQFCMFQGRSRALPSLDWRARPDENSGLSLSLERRSYVCARELYVRNTQLALH